MTTNSFDTLADRIRDEAAQASRSGQMQRLEALADEVARLRRGARTLGDTLDFYLTLIKDVTGSDDVIAADGDGDWGLVAERLAAMKATPTRRRGAGRDGWWGVSADVDLAAWRERAEFWTTRDPSTIGHLYDETAVKFAGEVMYLLDRLREAEVAVEHWKAHAEEAGEGFSRVCREHARSLARLTRIETLVIEWEDQGRTWPSGFDFRAALTGAQDADERAGASERGRG